MVDLINSKASHQRFCIVKVLLTRGNKLRGLKLFKYTLTLEFQIEGDGGINREAGKSRPK